MNDTNTLKMESGPGMEVLFLINNDHLYAEINGSSSSYGDECIPKTSRVKIRNILNLPGPLSICFGIIGSSFNFDVWFRYLFLSHQDKLDFISIRDHVPQQTDYFLFLKANYVVQVFGRRDDK